MIKIGSTGYTPVECAGIYLAQMKTDRAPLESVCIMQFITRYLEGFEAAVFENSVIFIEHIDILLTLSVKPKK